MSDSAEFIVKLTDQVSDPAKAADAALGAMTSALGGLGVGLVAVTAVVATTAVVIAGAFVTAGLDGAKTAIELTEANARLKASFGALAGSSAAGADALRRIDAVAGKMPFAIEQMRSWGEALVAAGFKGKHLEAALKAVAAAESLNTGGGAAAQEFLEKLGRGGAAAKLLLKSIQAGGNKGQEALKGMGLTTHDLAKAAHMTDAAFAKAKITTAQLGLLAEKALKAKSAGTLGAMMASWPVLLMKAKEGFMSLFSGLAPAVKPFMAAVKSLFDQFGKGQGPMKALKAVVTEVFGAIFKIATIAVKAISAFVKENFTAKNVASLWGSVKGVFAAVGGAIWKVVSAIGRGVAAMVAWAKSAEGQKKIHGIMAQIKGAIAAVGHAIGVVVGWFRKVASNATAMEVIKGIFKGIAVAIAVCAVVSAVVFALMMAPVVLVIAIIGVLGAAISRIPAAFRALPATASAVWASIVAGVKRIPGAIAFAIGFAIGTAIKFFMSLPGKAKSAFMAIVGFAMALPGRMTAIFTSIASKVISTLAGLPAAAAAMAVNVVSSLISGAAGMVGKVVAAFSNLGSMAKKGLMAALGIASPSKVGISVGKNVGESTAAGATSTVSKVKSAAAALGKAATPKPGKPGAAAAGAGGATVTIGELHYHGAASDFPDFEVKVMDLFERAAKGGAPAGVGPNG